MANPDATLPESYGHALAHSVALVLRFANAPLAVFNMILVKPLDGGYVAEEVACWYRGYDRPAWEGDADWWKLRCWVVNLLIRKTYPMRHPGTIGRLRRLPALGGRANLEGMPSVLTSPLGRGGARTGDCSRVKAYDHGHRR